MKILLFMGVILLPGCFGTTPPVVERADPPLSTSTEEERPERTVAAPTEGTILRLRVRDAGAPVNEELLRCVCSLPGFGSSSGSLRTDSLGGVERPIGRRLVPGSLVFLQRLDGSSATAVWHDHASVLTLDFEKPREGAVPIRFVEEKTELPIVGLRVSGQVLGRFLPLVTDDEGVIWVDGDQQRFRFHTIHVGARELTTQNRSERSIDGVIELPGSWVRVQPGGQFSGDEDFVLTQMKLGLLENDDLSSLSGLGQHWGFFHGTALEVSECDVEPVLIGWRRGGLLLGRPIRVRDRVWRAELREPPYSEFFVRTASGALAHDAMFLIEEENEARVSWAIPGYVLRWFEGKYRCYRVGEDPLESPRLISTSGVASFEFGQGDVHLSSEGCVAFQIHSWTQSIVLIEGERSTRVRPRWAGIVTAPLRDSSAESAIVEIEFKNQERKRYRVNVGEFREIDESDPSDL